MGQAGTPVSDSDSFLGDMQLDPRASPALSRRQLGSGEITNGFIRLEQDYSASPDVTPNGSLRRRPSRVLAGEDELMSFLRSSTGPGDGSGHVSRDRKAAYGSLGRWHHLPVMLLLLLTCSLSLSPSSSPLQIALGRVVLARVAPVASALIC